MLLEVFFACLIFGLTATVLIKSSTQVFRHLHDNDIAAIAWEVMDQQLVLLESIGIDSILENNQTEGKVARENIEFYWNADTEEQDLSQLHRITLTVSWQQKEKNHFISASTFLNGKPLTEELTQN